MSHTGRLDLGGGVSVDVLRDAVTDHPRALPDAFPGTPAGGWDAVRAAHPDTVEHDGRWRLHVDLVVLTHLHRHHVGWLADPRSGRATFSRARHVVGRDEWASTKAPQPPGHVQDSLGPVEAAGLLDVGGELPRGLEALPLPGLGPSIDDVSPLRRHAKAHARSSRRPASTSARSKGAGCSSWA